MHLMTEEDFKVMHNLLEDCETFIAEDDTNRILDNFNAFNNLIYSYSQMVRLKEIVTELQAYLVYFRKISISSVERRKRALSEHWMIYRGMKNKDHEQITLITHEHLNSSLEFILKEMRPEQND
ncbi:HTH-type transcriptional regulator [Streptococcus pyogenes]|nr:HTH-type transcriptional regulator [Streptococcus pyogenes]